MSIRIKSFGRCCRFAGLLTIYFACNQFTYAQTKVSLDDLSFFKTSGKTWQIAADVRADIGKDNFIETTKGTGVLVNVTDRKNRGSDIYSIDEFGDIDLELEYLMAAGSNSGIYLQGNYEIQLRDSWTSATLKSGDNAGIYERWDESKPDGKKGYEGYAPRQNVSRAPGLWQRMKISFQAPRFEGGKKVANAKILRLELNGVVVHEGVELFGVTRGASTEERPTGPLRIQGDHGAVALRNIAITRYDNQRPQIENLTYKVFAGRFTREDQTNSLTPVQQGPTAALTTEVNSIPNEFGILYEGTLQIGDAGEYHFDMTAFGGTGQLTIGGQNVIAPTEWAGKGKVTLASGQQPFRIFYSKYVDWAQPIMSLRISGPGIRQYTVHESPSTMFGPVDPIYVSAAQNTLLRSFIDLPGDIRVTHAVSVGSPRQIHYTYDLDHGSIVQVWRGEFLDATPMWHERGDGSSRARGSVLHFGNPALMLARMSTANASWKTDTIGTRFKTKGYRLDAEDQPTFLYEVSGVKVSDAVTLLNGSQGITRTLTVDNAGGDLYIRLVSGSRIDPVSDNLFIVDDKTYYIKLHTTGIKPIIRQSEGKTEMLIPIQKQVSYSIIF